MPTEEAAATVEAVVESAELLVAQVAGVVFGDAFASSWHNYGATTTASIPSATTSATTAASTYHLTATGGASGTVSCFLCATGS
jgi:hypothetical protein